MPRKLEPGIERDIFDAKNFEQIDDQIGTVTCGHKTSIDLDLYRYVSIVARITKGLSREVGIKPFVNFGCPSCDG